MAWRLWRWRVGRRPWIYDGNGFSACGLCDVARVRSGVAGGHVWCMLACSRRARCGLAALTFAHLGVVGARVLVRVDRERVEMLRAPRRPD